MHRLPGGIGTAGQRQCEGTLHLDWGHRYPDDLKLFVGYCREEETAAITTEHGGMNETCWSCSGGHLSAAGLQDDVKRQQGRNHNCRRRIRPQPAAAHNDRARRK